VAFEDVLGGFEIAATPGSAKVMVVMDGAGK
jgi:hypothetical protein